MKLLPFLAVFLVGCSKVNVTVESPPAQHVEHPAEKAGTSVTQPARVEYRVVEAPRLQVTPPRQSEIQVAPAYRLSPIEGMTPTERERYFRELQILNPPVIYR